MQELLVGGEGEIRPLQLLAAGRRGWGWGDGEKWGEQAFPPKVKVGGFVRAHFPAGCRDSS